MIVTSSTEGKGLLVVDSCDRGRATFSADRRFRYSLERFITPRSVVDERGCDRVVTFVMLNPSTADAFKDDRTISKCIGYATRLGADTLKVVNLFALRSTDPKVLKASGALPLAGADGANDIAIIAAVIPAIATICAWGNHGALWDRAKDVATRVLDGIALQCLATSKDGNPMHPLYLKNELQPVPWSHP